jgi:uncharacterized OB-fold protein
MSSKTPRRYDTYRGFKRANKLWSAKAEPTGKVYHPPLVRKVSLRGEVHYG